MEKNILILTQRIKELEWELKKIQDNQWYGLKWENKVEEFEERAKDALPILKEQTKLRIDNKHHLDHLIIEWDNFHSLSTLSYTHKWAIDVIYIDPPYNTWKKDFIYNDNYVDKEDSYKHSKRLSFMNKRLRLAKNLLSEKWIIFISIDDNEIAQLKILCDNIFSDTTNKGYIWTLIWQRAKGGGNSKKVVKGHEYVLCYSLDDELTLTQKWDKSLAHIRKWKKGKAKDKYIIKEQKLYFINDDFIRRVFGKYKKWTERRCEYENLLKFKSELLKSDVDEKLSSGEYILKKNSNGMHYICRLEEVSTMRQVMYTIMQWFLSEVWKNDLADLDMETSFDYPKPVWLIKNILDSAYNSDAIVLDFFAWSWTTWQAVLELNKEDWGDRQFILCSSKENTKTEPDKNVCKNVTYERVKRVMQWYTNSKGENMEWLNWWNFRYYTTEFIKTTKSTDDLRHRFINLCDDLLCIKEDTFDEVKTKKGSEYLKIFKKQNKCTAILYDIHHFDKLLHFLGTTDWNISVYIFSLSKEIYEEEITYLDKDITIQNIPDDILQTYKKIFNF